MFHQDFNQNLNKDELAAVKDRIYGSMSQDRGTELNEVEYLKIEISEIKEKRRSISMPLLATGTMILLFSFAANTLGTQIFAFCFATICIALGIWVISTYTKQLAALQARLEKTEQKSDC